MLPFVASCIRRHGAVTEAVHPALKKRRAVRPDDTVAIEQASLCLDEHLGLAKGQHSQIRENVAQMLLRHGRADRSDRNSQHAARIACPGAPAVGARGLLNRIFQHAGDRAVRFGGDKQQRAARGGNLARMIRCRGRKLARTSACRGRINLRHAVIVIFDMKSPYWLRCVP